MFLETSAQGAFFQEKVDLEFSGTMNLAINILCIISSF